MVSQHLSPLGAVLDVGPHSGALHLRLKERGFAQLMGADLDPTRFDVPDAEFKRAKRNKPFGSHSDIIFQLITTTEIIERLDSPRSFLKETPNMLEDDGRHFLPRSW